MHYLCIYNIYINICTMCIFIHYLIYLYIDKTYICLYLIKQIRYENNHIYQYSSLNFITFDICTSYR